MDMMSLTAISRHSTTGARLTTSKTVRPRIRSPMKRLSMIHLEVSVSRAEKMSVLISVIRCT